MITKTFSQLETVIREELDLTGETGVVTQTALIEYVNQAIDKAEALIHTIYEDYFLRKSTLAMVSSETDIALPTDIYGEKIRSLVYHNGTDIYEVKRLRGIRPFARARDITQYGAALDYQYMLNNESATTGIKLVLYPASRESSSNLHIWYLRNANRITTTTDVCDIPEFYPYIIAYAKLKVVLKLKDRDISTFAAEETDQQRLMVETLTNRIPDDDDTVPLDLSFYSDFNEGEYSV